MAQSNQELIQSILDEVKSSTQPPQRVESALAGPVESIDFGASVPVETPMIDFGASTPVSMSVPVPELRPDPAQLATSNQAEPPGNVNQDSEDIARDAPGAVRLYGPPKRAKSVLIGPVESIDFGASIPVDTPKNVGRGLEDITRDAPGGFVDNVVEFGKGIPPGAVRLFGTAFKGLAALTQQGSNEAQEIAEELKRVPEMTFDEVRALQRRASRSLPTGSSVEVMEAIRAMREGTLEGEDAAFTPPLNTREGGVQDSTPFEIGQMIEEFSRGILPAQPGMEQSIGRQLGEGVGSLLGGVAVSALGGPSVGGAFFALAGSGEAVERAVEADATEEQLITAAKSGLFPGLTDSAPIEILLQRFKIPMPDLGPVMKAISRIGFQAFVEGVQESGQEFLQNLIAREIHTPDQDLIEGLPGSAGVGSGVGGIAGTVGEIITAPSRRRARNAGRSPAPTSDEIMQTAVDAMAERLRDAPTMAEGVQEPAVAPQAPVEPQSTETVPTEQDEAPTQDVPQPEGQPDEALLRGAGYSDEQINAMAADERQEALDEAIAQNVEPDYSTQDVALPEDIAEPELAEDVPSAEPAADIMAQLRELKSQSPTRTAVWLPKATRDHLESIGQLEDALTRGVVIEDFDGQGGTLIAANQDVADIAQQYRDSGMGNQELIGVLTGAGRGKPADGTKIVQNRDEAGNVTRESLVTEEEVEATAQDFEQTGAEPVVTDPETALETRETKVGIESATANVNTEPTDGQKEAGNYKKGHLTFQGLDITIENPRGSTRSGVDANGAPWSVEIPAHYGYIKRTEGADGDQVDVYIGDDVNAGSVFIVDQKDLETGKFDEHKVMLGTGSLTDAQELYEAGFSDGRGGERIQSITEMTIPEFQEWLKDGDQTQEAVTQASNEPAKQSGKIRVYHSGVQGEGSTGRWVSTSRQYASDYRADLPLFFLDLEDDDARVNNADYPDQSARKGFTFNFELTSQEAQKLGMINRAHVEADSRGSVSTASSAGRAELTSEQVDRLQSLILNSKISLAPKTLAKELGASTQAIEKTLGRLYATNQARGFTRAKNGNYRRIANRGPLDIVQYLSSRGGLAADPGGDILAADLGKLFVPSFGRLVRKEGMSLNEARLALIEGNYVIPGDDIVGAIKENVAGNKLYALEDRNEIAERDSNRRIKEEEDRLNSIRGEIKSIVNEADLQITDALVEEMLPLIVNDGMDIEDAVYDVLEKDAINGVEEQDENDDSSRADKIGQDPAPPGFDDEESVSKGQGKDASRRAQHGSAEQADSEESQNQDQLNEQVSGELAGRKRAEPETKTETGAGDPAVGSSDIRSNAIPADVGNPVSVFSKMDPLKQHPDYKAAKAGDDDAAMRLVHDLVGKEHYVEALNRFGKDVIYAPAIAEEASGRNKIPHFMAEFFAGNAGGETSQKIVQSNRAFHTGAKAAERLIARPLFEGAVEKGKKYVIIDDVTVMGSTIAEMAHHILDGGGEVVGVVTLVNASRLGVFLPTKQTVRKIKGRFGHEIRNQIGVEPEALTAAEAQYILNFRDADALRNRIFKARRDRVERLREKENGGDGPVASESRAELGQTDEQPLPERSTDSESAPKTKIDPKSPRKSAKPETKVTEDADSPIGFEKSEQVIDFATSQPGHRLITSDGDISVQLDRAGYVFQAAEPKGRGGKYYLDQNILDIAGQEFVRRGDVMVLEIGDKAKAADIVKAIMEVGQTTFAAVAGEQSSSQVADKKKAPPKLYSFTMTKKAAENRTAIETEAAGIIRRIAGPDVGIKFHDKIIAEGEGQRAGGYYVPAEHLVGLAMADKAFDPLNEAGHEAWHAVEESGLLTEPERAVLEREQARLKVVVSEELRAPLNGPRIAAMSPSEINAVAFARYRRLREEGRQISGIHIGVRRFFERVYQILTQIGSALRGRGFKTASSIFEGVRRGKAAKRTSKTKGRPTGRLFSMTESGTGVGKISPARFEPPIETPIEVWLDRTLPMFDRVKGTMGVATYRVARNFQDRFIDVKRVQSAIAEARGEAIPEQMDTYLAESLYYGKTGEKLIALRERFLEPLVNKMVQLGITADELNSYLYARHARERNARIASINPDIPEGGSGMSDHEAADILDQFEADGKTHNLQRLEAVVHRVQNETRTTLRRTGLISEEELDAWTQAYDNYVPLRGHEGLGEDEGPRTGRGFDIRGKESKRAFGRRSRAEGPLFYVIAQAQQAIIRSEKNRVSKTFLRMVQNNPNPAVWEINVKKKRQQVNPATGLVEEVHDHLHKLSDNVLSVKVGGKEHYITIHHAGLAEAMKKMGAENLGAVSRLMAKYTRFLSMMSTSLNPEFVLSNFSRDFQTAMVHLSETDAPKIRRKVMMDLPKAIKGVYGGARGKRDTEWQKYYHEFAEAGGKISFFNFENIDTIKKRIDGILEHASPTTWTKTKEVGIAVEEFVDNVNAAIENGVRLSTYVNARRAGLTAAKAASAARELTVNFNRKGRYGPHMNAFYMFFNAAVQGNVRMGLAFAHSKTVRRITAGVTATSFAIGIMNHLIAEDDDEDGQNFYDKIPFWKKERNIILMIPGSDTGQRIMIPLPYGYNIFYAAGEQLASVIMGGTEPTQGAANVVTTLANAFNPIGSGGSLLSFIAPTILDPAVDIATNTNWFGGPVMPQDYGRSDRRPQSQRYFDSVSPTLREATRLMNEATGGNEWRSGYIDVSPEIMEHMIDSVIGGLGKFAGNAEQTISRVIRGEAFEPSKTPFLRRVYGANSAYADQSLYYDIEDRVFGVEYELKGMLKANLRDSANVLRQDSRAELSVLGMFKQTRNQVRQLSRQRRAVRANEGITDADRQERLDSIQERKRQAMNRARRRYYDAVARLNQ